MDSHVTRRFRKLFRELDPGIKRDAKQAYRLWLSDHYHPGLHFKPLEGHQNLWSVRIGLNHRALGVKDGDEITWVWIGSHDDYDKRI